MTTISNKKKLKIERNLMESFEFLHLMEAWNKYGWITFIVLIERIIPKRKYPIPYKGIISDMVHMFDSILKPLVVAGGVWLLNYLLPSIQGTSLRIPADWSIWIHVPIIIVISEFTFYWIHRFVHSNRILWEFHRVHHSSTMYQSLMTSRFHPIDSSLFVVPYIFLVSLLDLNMWVVFGFGFFQGFMDKYGHCNINVPRWTGYFISNPNFHSWHHSNDVEAINKNFSRDFVFFDYIFKTAYYPKNNSPSSFGDKNYTTNYMVQLYKPFQEILLMAKRCSSNNKNISSKQ